MFKKLVKLAQTQEEFDAQASKYLLKEGFEDTQEYHQLYGAFLQHMDATTDSFDPKAMARMIRKQRANQFAFYLMYPDKRPKPTEKTVNDTTGTTEVKTDLVQKA